MSKTIPILALFVLSGCGADSMSAGGMPDADFGAAGRDGSQDAGYFRAVLQAGLVPEAGDITLEGFLAEHDLPYTGEGCDQVLCISALVARDQAVAEGGLATFAQLAMASNVNLADRPRAPVSLAAVVDVSGSMSADDRLSYVKQGLMMMVGELGPEDRLALVTYSTAAQVVLPSQPVTNGAIFIEAIQALTPNGSTNLYDGMVQGYEQLLAGQQEGMLSRVMLLSDGLANTGVSDSASILAKSATYGALGLGITTVGVGLDFNHDLMRELAEQGGGNFYFIEDPEKLTTVFQEELDFLVTPLANNLDLQLTLGAGYTLAETYGLAYSIDELGRAQVHVPTVFASRKGGAILLRLAAAASEAEIQAAPVLEITYSYEPIAGDGGVGPRVELAAEAALPALDTQGRAFTHPTVHKTVVLWNMVQSFRAAADATHLERSPTAGLGHIQALAAYVDDANQTLADAEISADRLELINQFARNLGGDLGEPIWSDGQPMPMGDDVRFEDNGMVFFPFGCQAAAPGSLIAALAGVALLHRRRRARRTL